MSAPSCELQPWYTEADSGVQQVIVKIAMNSVEEYFKQFSKETSVPRSTFYIWKLINNLAAEDNEILRALNQNALFWNIAMHSLQCTFFISLGRIFDTDSKAFSVHKLLKKCIEDIRAFSKDSLRKRKIGAGPEPDWISEYMKNAYEPSKKDFQYLRGEVSKKHKEYEQIYKPIRHKVFAHADLKAITDKQYFFAQTSIDGTEEILAFLYQIEMIIFQLLYNGRLCKIGDFNYDEEQYHLRDINSLLSSLKKGIIDRN